MELGLPSIEPKRIVSVQYEPRAQIQVPPRVFSRELCVGPFIGASGRPQEEITRVYEEEMETTCGSEEPETLRFRVSDGLMSSLLLGFPFERIGELQGEAVAWSATRTISGTLRHCTGEDFCLVETTNRLIDHEASVLMAVTDEGLDRGHQKRLRLEIARDVYFLFADGLYCGWQVENPVGYLVPHSVTLLRQANSVSRVDREFFRRYLLILDDDCLGFADPEDLTPADHDLLRLYEDLKAGPGDGMAAQAIREELETLLYRVIP